MPNFQFVLILEGACFFAALDFRRIGMDSETESPYIAELAKVPAAFNCYTLGFQQTVESEAGIGDIVVVCNDAIGCSDKRVVVTRHSEALHNVAEEQASSGTNLLMQYLKNGQLEKRLRADPSGASARKLAEGIAHQKAQIAGNRVASAASPRSDRSDAQQVMTATQKAVMAAYASMIKALQTATAPTDAEDAAKNSVLTSESFTDARLTPKGRAMVMNKGRVGIRNIFLNSQPDLVVISPLSRTLETGILLYSANGPQDVSPWRGDVPAIATDLVIERQSRDKRADQRKRFSQLVDRLEGGVTHLRDWDLNLGQRGQSSPMFDLMRAIRVRVRRPGFPGPLTSDETNDDMRMRARLFMHMVLPFAGQSVHVVSHKGFIRELTAFLTQGMPHLSPPEAVAKIQDTVETIGAIRKRFHPKSKMFELSNAESLGFRIMCKPS